MAVKTEQRRRMSSQAERMTRHSDSPSRVGGGAGSRCEATIFALRHERQGNYSGPIEIVGPSGAAFSRSYNVRLRTIAEVCVQSSICRCLAVLRRRRCARRR